MSDEEVDGDWFIILMALAMFLFIAVAIVTSAVHLLYQHGFRLSVVPFVAVIEYSLMMSVVTILVVIGYVVDLPNVSLSDLEGGTDHDWDEVEAEEENQ